MLAPPVFDRITGFDELVKQDSLPPGVFMDVRIRRFDRNAAKGRGGLLNIFLAALLSSARTRAPAAHMTQHYSTVNN